MKSKRSACNPEHLMQFWSETITPGELSVLENHLSVCEQCQGMFESELEQYSEISSAAGWLKEHASENVSARMRPAAGETHALDTDALNDIAKRMFDTSDDPAMLGKLDEFEIVEALGAGGMGIVFKGYDSELNRFVAIKILSSHVSVFGTAKQRFVREAQSAARIVSPYVVPIHKVASHAEIPYLVMSYVPGVNLQELIDEVGALTPLQSLRIARQVAMGLAAAHACGLIHRDVKPGNILIERNGQRAMLTDFGLAQAADDASLTHSGLLAGTPNFMSPEQAQGGDIDARSDLFSLGSVLYSMLAGHPPFRGLNAYAVVKRLSEETPRPLTSVQPTTPLWLERLVQCLLEKAPANRVQDADQLVALLASCERHLEHPSLHAIPVELQPHPTSLRRLGMLGLAIFCGCVGLFFIVKPWEPAASGPVVPEPVVPAVSTVQPSTTKLPTEPPTNRVVPPQSGEAVSNHLYPAWPDEIDAGRELRKIADDIDRLELESP